MDALQSKVKSLNGNLYANFFTNGKYMRVYPTASKSLREFADSLTDFTDDVGIPDTVFCDLAPEYVRPCTPFMKEVQQLKIRMRNAEKDEWRSKTIKLKLRLENRRSNGRPEWLSGKFCDVFGIMGLYIAQKSDRLSQGAMTAGPGWKKSWGIPLISQSGWIPSFMI